ncbi:MAG: excinuclease ABC subunit UvrC [Chitinophagales bacterium]|nr:excinuclease ABC subunit UvrC [Chitinophagales bacterium]MDW8419588.1 excinuclease ABC subunit UvrC [Chitinophagales bacterium]
MTPDEFKEIRHTIPEAPGVYRYYDAAGEVLYIGKAKDLRKRVSSYFLKNDHSNRITRMVRQIARIEFTIVSTEQDAFLLENSLIKSYRPRYNIQLRDDKTYPFICIKKEEFPRVFFTRQVVRDGSEYLGPYTSVNSVRSVMEMLTEIFPLRTCSLHLSDKNIAAGKFKVCLEYHLKRCMGPCQGFQSREEYDENIQQIRELLKSNFTTVIQYLRRKMNEYAEQLDFERAQEFKQKIERIEAYQSKTTIVNPRLHNLEVYGYTETDDMAFINYLRIGNGTIVRARMFEVKRVLDETKEEILARAIMENSFEENQPIEEFILPFDVELPPANCPVTVPLAGDKKKLLDLAQRNALYLREERLKQNMTAEERHPTFRLLKTVKEDLKLKELPRHIECFDNSNLQGTNAVSACVVFKNAKPSKKDYRIFHVKSVEGPDDFATMREVIYRRYKRMLDEGQELPQLIIIDGGKGQLSSAAESLKALNLYGQIALVGIAKRLEEIYFPEDTTPLYINKKSETLRLIQRMRDEAHRFGITHHRKRRSKNALHSELLQIKGVGPKTFELLLKKYRSVAKLREATREEIAALVGDARARLVYEGLHAVQPTHNENENAQ